MMDPATLYASIRQALAGAKPAAVFEKLSDVEECRVTRDSFIEKINSVCQAHDADFELSYSQKDEAAAPPT